MSQWCFKHTTRGRSPANSRPGQPQWYFHDETGASRRRIRSRNRSCSPGAAQRRRGTSSARGRAASSMGSSDSESFTSSSSSVGRNLSPVYDGRYGPMPTMHDVIPEGCSFSSNQRRTRTARLHKRAVKYLFCSKVLCSVFLIACAVYTIIMLNNWLN